MQQGPATRAALLQLTTQQALAEQGHVLLDQKRSALLEAFRASVQDALRASEELARAAEEARRTLRLAMATDGPQAVASAAWSAQGEVFVEAGTTTIMGVRVPEIGHQAVGRARTARGYSMLATSAAIDGVADRFEAQLDRVLEVAATEVRLTRLAREIKDVTRRANALEHQVIPRLAAERRRIRLALDDQEREDQFRVRRVRTRRRTGSRCD